jgi:importin-5
LEQLLALNIEWMLDVEEDVNAWTAQADADDEEEIDGEAMTIGEENFDRIAEQCAEKETLETSFMPLLFKVIRTILAAPNADWKHTRSAVMAVSQIVEYIDEDADQGAAWVDQCVNFLLPFLNHAHPRVRYSAFQAIGQVAYDHEPYVQETHYEALLPAIVLGMDDTNIRVATNAVSSFCAIGEELDQEALEPYLEDIMTKLFTRLQQGQSKSMQEQCLSAIAVVGEAAEDLFLPYYGTVMPALKQIIATATGEDKRVLRGKAFECASLVGVAVGKETFQKDAHEVMQMMAGCFQAGFAADDPTREYAHEAAGRIATILQKDFKPYLPALLPSIFTILAQKPQEVDVDDADKEDEMTYGYSKGKVMALKTSVLDEMSESLTLIADMIEALEEEFCEYLPATCTHLMPLLEFPVSEDVQEKAYHTWEMVVESARNSAEKGKCDKSVVGQLAGEFLKTTVARMAEYQQGEGQDTSALASLQAQSNAVSGVIRKAGTGVLAKGDVQDLVKVIMELLGRVTVGANEPVQPVRKLRGKEAKAKSADSDDEESDIDEGEATHQSVRFALVDVAGALMRSSRLEFVELGLPILMELVKKLLQGNASEADRSLALYIADDVVDCLGELSVPYWNIFMEHACHSITDKCPTVRQFSANVIGHGSRQQIFAQIAAPAATQLAKLLQKHGERHRRRRAVNAEAKQVALAVDAAIRALGLICEHQEKNVGGDCTSAWRMWLSHMPLRYDTELGQKAHAQLLELVVKNHSVVTAPEQLPRVLAIFADVYKTRFSNGVLDKELAAAVSRAGTSTVQRFAANLAERQQKKIETMLKDAGTTGQDFSPPPRT